MRLARRLDVDDALLQGSFRMSGVKGCRLLFLFEKGLLIAKKEKDGSLIMKASIKVSAKSLPGVCRSSPPNNVAINQIYVSVSQYLFAVMMLPIVSLHRYGCNIRL